MNLELIGGVILTLATCILLKFINRQNLRVGIICIFSSFLLFTIAQEDLFYALLSISMNFVLMRFIYKRFILELAVIMNIGILILLKGLKGSDIPLGISFYTFQIISFLVDSKEDESLRSVNLPSFTGHILFLPQLISGPICRAKQLLSQIQGSKTPLLIGPIAPLICEGLFRKLVIANGLAALSKQGINALEYKSDPLYFWCILFAYSLQIYNDFYGYILIARGVSRAMGIELPINFSTPYLASSLKGFWKRWNITLGAWFRDYVYIPLGGSKSKEFIFSRNILLVFLLSGVWHGLGVGFFFWGFLHGLFYLVQGKINKRYKTPRLIGFFCTQFVVLNLWAFFMTGAGGEGLLFIKKLYAFNKIKGLHYIFIFKNYLGLCFISYFLDILSQKKVHLSKKWVASFFYIGLGLLALFFGRRGHEFIYFQF